MADQLVAVEHIEVVFAPRAGSETLARRTRSIVPLLEAHKLAVWFARGGVKLVHARELNPAIKRSCWQPRKT